MCASGKFYALLIGINCYFPGVSVEGVRYPHLGGCVRDIDNVEYFLANRLQIDSANVIRLTASIGPDELPLEKAEHWPTYENMVAAFQKLTELAEPGDNIYFHYSGHGGRARTIVSDWKGPNGLDEALVPTDIHQPNARYLRDVELAVICQRIVQKGVRLGVVLDCCHSGGAVRGIRGIDDLIAVRGIAQIDFTSRPQDSLLASKEELASTLAAGQASGTRNITLTSGWLPEPTGYVLLAACRPTELAYEYAFSGGQRNGALTYWLLDALNRCGPGLSARSLHERLFAKVHSQFEQQTPQMQGDGNLYLLPGPATALLPLAASVLKVENRRVRMTSVGQAFGNCKGAQFAIYPLGITDFADPTKRVAIVSVVEVGAVESWAEISTRLRAEPIEQGAPAILLDQGSLKLRHMVGLAVTDAETDGDRKTVRDALVASISASAWLGIKTEWDDDTLEFQVAVNPRGQYEIWDPSGRAIAELAPPIEINEVDAAKKVASRLEHLAKYGAIRQLENHDTDSPLVGKLQVQLLGWMDDFTRGDKPNPQPFAERRDGPTVRPGQWIFLRISNTSATSLNVTVLDLQPDWGVSQLYPQFAGDWFVQFEPSEVKTIPLKAELPAGYSRGRDVLKVFATVGAANFGRLALPALDQPTDKAVEKRGSATKGVLNPLEVLIDAVVADPPTSVTRNLTPASYPSSYWISGQVEIFVERAS